MLNLPEPEMPMMAARHVKRIAAFLLRERIPFCCGHHPTYAGGEIGDGDIVSLVQRGNANMLGVIANHTFYPTHLREGDCWAKIQRGDDKHLDGLFDVSEVRHIKAIEGLLVGEVPDAVSGKAILARLEFTGRHSMRQEVAAKIRGLMDVESMKNVPPLNREVMDAEPETSPVKWTHIAETCEPMQGDLLVQLEKGPNGKRQAAAVGVVAKEGGTVYFHRTQVKKGPIYERHDDKPAPLFHNGREVANLDYYGRAWVRIRKGVEVSSIFDAQSRIRRLMQKLGL